MASIATNECRAGRRNGVRFFPSPSTRAQRCANDPASLVEGLFDVYRRAVEAFDQDPTDQRWRDRNHAFGRFYAAFAAECGDGGQ